MSKKVAVLLAGCGHLDGSEIRESILTLLSIDKCGAEAVSRTRHMIEEAARIARGKVLPLDA